MPFHYAETNANQVTQSAFDPISREPNYKQCAVRVERAPGGALDEDSWSSSATAWPAWPASSRSSSTRREFEITVFGDETHVNYNRILLSSVLAGEKAADEIVAQPARVVPAATTSDLRVGVADRRRRSGDEDRHRRRRQRHAVRQAAARDRQHARSMPPIDGLDKDGVFVFRTLDDTRALLERARPGVKAVVIGGGLLGLEAARGLQVQGCDVTVVHLMRHADGAAARSRPAAATCSGKMEELGIRVLLEPHDHGDPRQRPRRRRGASPTAAVLDADLVVVAAGIRPNVELGRKAGLDVNRGIVVNDYMETSRPRHLRRRRMRRASRRLLRPGGAAARAGQGAGGDDHRQQGPDLHRHRPGGEAQDHGRRRLLRRRLGRATDAEPVRYEDPALGIYKKLTVRDGKLAGVILVGDTSDSHRYMDWLRDGHRPRRRSAAICCFRRPAPTPALDVAADARQRDGLRLRRRHQGRDHRRRFTSRASTRCRS